MRCQSSICTALDPGGALGALDDASIRMLDGGEAEFIVR